MIFRKPHIMFNQVLHIEQVIQSYVANNQLIGYVKPKIFSINDETTVKAYINYP